MPLFYEGSSPLFDADYQDLLEEDIREIIDKGYVYGEEKINEFWFWHMISSSSNISEEFIAEFRDKVVWTTIAWYHDLSENFLLNNLDRIYIIALDHNQYISDELKEKVKFMKELQS
jgi:hypothetical protein